MAIGVDFGGTRIKIAKVDGERVVRENKVDTPAGQPPEFVLRTLVDGILAVDPKPTTVGLAIPGQVDPNGVCYRLPNVPGFENFNISAFVEPLLQCPVHVENDGNAAAHGEALFGMGKQYQSFALFTLGTGIGGGLVFDGRLRSGCYGFAAEVGHITVDNRDDAWECACGKTGCVESYAGTRALLRKFREMGGGEAEEVLQIAESARAGHAAGVAAFDMMAESLARAITILQTLLDLDAIGFTGGISGSFDLVEKSLRGYVRRMAYSKPLGDVPLMLSELGARAGVIGAAHLYLLKTRSTGS